MTDGGQWFRKAAMTNGGYAYTFLPKIIVFGGNSYRSEYNLVRIVVDPDLLITPMKPRSCD